MDSLLPPTREQVIALRRALQEWSRENEVVCVVVRTHPLLGQELWLGAEPSDDAILLKGNETVSVELTHWNDEGQCIASLNKGRRSDLKFARRSLRLSWNCGWHEQSRESLQVFQELYNDHMRARRAKEFYFFPDSYYADLARGLDERLAVGLAWRGSDPVGGALFMADARYAHYHLSACNLVGYEYKASTLLVNGGASWARLRGCDQLHLGGGLKQNDTLFRFKQSFGGKLFRYGTVTIIADHAAFSSLCQMPNVRWPFAIRALARSRGAAAGDEYAEVFTPVGGVLQDMREQVVGLGAGGHAKVLIEILRARDCFNLVGLLDSDPGLKDKLVMGLPVLGDDSMLPSLKKNGVRRFFVGVGSVGDASERKRMYEKGLALGMEPVSSIHPSAIISPSVELGNGSMIMAGVVISSCVKLGDNVIVNTGAVVDHDCCLGDHVHVATGARLSGTVRVGAGAHIGAGAVIRQNINIGDGAVVGAGAAVVRDVAANEVVVGVPARTLRSRARSAYGRT